MAFQAKPGRRARNAAFTLFELILAIALSVALLALIGTAINLYLLRVDASRTRIEEAQLARSILARIADDLRATTVYKPQDTSTVASLVASSANFDVDSVDSQNPGSSGGGGGTGGGGGGAGSATSGGGASLGGGSSMAGSSSAGAGAETDLTLPLGLNGTISEMFVDVEQLPPMEELFLTNTGYTNTRPLSTPVGILSAAPPRPSNVKTVRYFIRQGRPLEPGSPAVTSLAPELQLETGGLVRQEIDRPVRVWAESSGDQTVLESGQALLAPEVVNIEFRYFNGTQVVDYWDMKEMGMLPPAIEVRIWILASNANELPPLMPNDLAGLMARSHEYRQIVFLPMSAISSSAASSAMSGATSSSTSSSSSSSSSSETSGSGSSFDQ